MVLAQAALSAVPQARAVAAVVDSAQAAQFRSLVQSGAVGGTTAPGATPAQSATAAVQDTVSAAQAEGAASIAGATAPAAGSANLGDAILRGLEGARAGLQHDWAAVTALVDPRAGPPSTQRLLQFQVGVLHVGFEQQMIAGLASKTVQNIDQLVKMQ